MRQLLVLAAVLVTGLPALAQESLLIGRVERISMVPRDADACPSACAAAGIALKPGTVCVSNDGGCQQTTFRIERVLAGDERAGMTTFDMRTGEWGKMYFPVTHAPILVYIDGAAGRVRWSLLAQRDGHTVFEAKPFERTTVAGVAIASLPPDSNGEIALDELIGRLPNKR